MKAYICDQCRKTEEPDTSYDLWPVGWVQINPRNSRTQHACSQRCAEAVIARLYVEEKEPAHAG